MTRLPHFTPPGIPQPVIQRGNNRQACFAAVDHYCFYLECLNDASRRHSGAVHALLPSLLAASPGRINRG